MANSSFLTGRNALIGTVLQAPGAGELPDDATYMYWPAGVTPGWPAAQTKANFDKHNALWGARTPQIVRLYSSATSGVFDATGTTGSAGDYGLIKPDWRDIANAGTVLMITFSWTQTGSTVQQSWANIANGLNAATDNIFKQNLRQLATNLRRWEADTANTAPVKKIIFGFHHEPDGDGPAADYVKAFRAIMTYLARRGIGDANRRINVPLDGATAPGGTATSFHDLIEVAMVATGYGMGSPAGNYPYWPGDDICLWFFSDPYNWGGGQSGTNSGSGHIPQPGDAPGSRYTDKWVPLKQPMQEALNFSDTHPDVLLGLAEFGTSEDVDRYTVSGGALVLPKVHTAVPLAKGDWFRQTARFMQGLASNSSALAQNVFTADTRARRVKAWVYWNDQALMPRWFNVKPHMPGDVNAPSSTGTTASSSYDGFVAMVNDPYFNVGTTTVINPSGLSVHELVDTNGVDYTFTVAATKGSAPFSAFTVDFGDGSDPVILAPAAGVSASVDVVHTYLRDGPYTVRFTADATDGGTATIIHTISVATNTTTVDPGGGGGTSTPPTIDPLAGAPYLLAGDLVRDLRFKFNPAVDQLARYAADRTSRRTYKSVAVTAYTLAATDQGCILEFSADTAVTVTVPDNASVPFGFGAYIDIVQRGAGTVTLVGASGVVLNTPQTLTTRARYSMVRVTLRNVINSWIVSGDLTTGAGTGNTGTTVTPTTDDVFIHDFNSGPLGAALALTNWASHAGANGTYDADAIEGAFSARWNLASQTSQYRMNLATPLPLLWFAFYIKLDALPPANIFLAEWYGTGGTVKIGDLKINPDGTPALRDVSATVLTSGNPLVPGQWARIAVKVQPGSPTGHQLREYLGAVALNGATPTFNGSAAATAGAQTAVDMIRFGVMSATATSAQFRLDRLHGNSTVEPAPLAG